MDVKRSNLIWAYVDWLKINPQIFRSIYGNPLKSNLSPRAFIPLNISVAPRSGENFHIDGTCKVPVIN